MTPFIEANWPWLVAIIGGLIVSYITYRIGRGHGATIAKLLGAYCDVCERVAEQFYNFQMTVVCKECFERIKSNKSLKCKFCDHPIDRCTCEVKEEPKKEEPSEA